MKHLKNVLNRLEGVRQHGDYWSALCPAHADREQSLNIALGEGNRVLLKCHAGCRIEAILAAIGLKMRDLYAHGRDAYAPAPVATSIPRKANPDLRHVIYSMLVAGGSLTDEHRAELVRRGLTEEEIDRNGYISSKSVMDFPFPEDSYLGHNRHQLVAAVPGLQLNMGGMPIFRSEDGLLIPVRDHWRRVVAVQVRVGGHPKYVWPRGTMTTLHVPLQTNPYSPKLWITEGPLKADVAAALGGLPVVGVPGVAQWATLGPLLRGKPRRKIVIAFDADWITKPQVAEQRLACARVLAKSGHAVYLADWPLEVGKGLDDLLLTGRMPEVRAVHETAASVG
jgi:hypothetical protein